MFFLIAFSNCVAEFHIKIAIKRLLLASNKLYMYFQWLTMLLNQEVRAKKFYIIYNNVTEHDKVVEEVTGKVNFDGLVLDSSFFKWVVNTCHIVLHLYNCIILALHSSQFNHISFWWRADYQLYLMEGLYLKTYHIFVALWRCMNLVIYQNQEMGVATIHKL